MKFAIIFISSMSVIFFIIISSIRFVVATVIGRRIRKYENMMNAMYGGSMPNTEDPLSRDKNKEMYVNVQKIPRKFAIEEPDYDKKRIVGVVKSVGKFTSMILGEKITYMMQHAEKLKQNADKGVHVNTMNAHEIGSRSKGRGI